MAEKRAKETPSVTKPLGGNSLDARTIHPRGDKADYSKYTREEPYQGPSKGGYNNVGKKTKQTGSDERKRPQGDKADYSKFTKEEPYQGPSKGGYNNVGKCSKGGCEDARKAAPKSKSPWRK
jgi:hypothetical protein